MEGGINSIEELPRFALLPRYVTSRVIVVCRCRCITFWKLCNGISVKRVNDCILQDVKSRRMGRVGKLEGNNYSGRLEGGKIILK